MTIEIRIIHIVAPPRYRRSMTELLNSRQAALSSQLERNGVTPAGRLQESQPEGVRFKRWFSRVFQRQRLIKAGFWVIMWLVIWKIVKLCANLLDAYGVAQLAGYCVTSLWRWF